MNTKFSDLDALALKQQPLTAKEVQRLKALSSLQGKMADMLIARFAQNIKAFEDFMPDIAATFKHYLPSTPLEFFCTENGIPNLIFPDKDHEILYKTDDPLALCDKQAELALQNHVFIGTGYKKEYDAYGQIHFRYLGEAVDTVKTALLNEKRNHTAAELKSCPNAVVVGLGLGYILQSIYERCEIVNLVVIEPNTDLFFASLHTFDWAFFLHYLKENGFGINLLIGQTPSQLTEDLGSYYTHHGRFLSGQCLCLVHYATAEIKELVNTLLKDYHRLHAAMGFFDDQLFGISHGLFAASHHSRFLRSDVNLPKDMRSLPLFVVGSGPSLDKDIAFLRAHQDQAVIIACGTALDTLYHAGIKPDFYACTERTPEIAQTLDAIPDQDFINSLTLIAGDVVHPNTQKHFKHTAIFGKPDEAFFWLSQVHGFLKKLRSVNVMNPIVGNLGVSAALGLGFERIYLFGLDNGKPHECNNMHSQFTATYNEHGINDNQGNYDLKKGIMLPGNFGGNVASNYIFSLANRHMELVISLYKKLNSKLQIYNCSGGARIDGALAQHSDELTFANFPNIDKQALMNFIHQDMSFDLSLTEDDCKKWCSPLLFEKACNELSKLWDNCPVSRVDFVKQLEKTSELLWTLSSSIQTRFAACLLEGTVQTIFIMALNALYHLGNEDQAVLTAYKVIKCFKNFLDDAKKLFELLPNYILGEHRHLLNGRLGFDHEESKAPLLAPLHRFYPQTPHDQCKVFKKRYS